MPEDKIRQRYERNQSLIRDAAMVVDKAIVYDNSQVDHPFRRVLEISDRGNNIAVGEDTPAWVFELYLAH